VFRNIEVCDDHERNFNLKMAKVVNLPVSLPLLRTINDVIE